MKKFLMASLFFSIQVWEILEGEIPLVFELDHC